MSRIDEIKERYQWRQNVLHSAYQMSFYGQEAHDEVAYLLDALAQADTCVKCLFRDGEIEQLTAEREQFRGQVRQLQDQLATAEQERDAARKALGFVWSRIEDNEAGWLERQERPWHATFEYEELEMLQKTVEAQRKEA